jgi:hypothetical protein
MFIADAQVHIWATHPPERPWPEDGFARTHRAALVPPSFEATTTTCRWPPPRCTSTGLP